MLALDDRDAPATFYPGAREGPLEPALLLHDYGGRRRDVAPLAIELSGRGRPCLAVELDGHGDSGRAIEEPGMDTLLEAALAELRRRSGAGGAAAVGVGFGGTLAMRLAACGLAAEAVALDPPAVDADGFPRVNAFAELSPLSVLSAFFRPPARGTGGSRVSLAALLRALDRPERPGAPVTVIRTAERWFNVPETLREYSEALGARSLTAAGNHSSLPASREVGELLHGTLS